MIIHSTSTRIAADYAQRYAQSLRAAFAVRRSSGQIPLIWMVSDSISALVAGSSAVRFWIFLCA